MMYKIRPDINIQKILNGKLRKELACEIEVASETVSRILNGSINTTYTTAFTIVKHIDSNLEVKDLFN